MKIYKKKGLPVEDELVICSVKRIGQHSAFVDLLEYQGVEGMLHISEVALKGVKRIKDHLSKGKQIICRVLEIKDDEVDVSLKRVKKSEQRRKLNESRIEKRFYQLISHASNNDKITNQLIESFINKYDSILNTYEALKEEGLKILTGINIPAKVKPELEKSLKTLINQLTVDINRSLKVHAGGGNGLERIKKLLTSFKPPKDIEVNINYEGSNKFRLTIKARNYKLAEKYYLELKEDLLQQANKLGCTVSEID